MVAVSSFDCSDSDGIIPCEHLGVWLDPLSHLSDGEVGHDRSLHILVNVLIICYESNAAVRFLDYLRGSTPLCRLLALLENLVCHQFGHQLLRLLRQVQRVLFAVVERPWLGVFLQLDVDRCHVYPLTGQQAVREYILELLVQGLHLLVLLGFALVAPRCLRLGHRGGEVGTQDPEGDQVLP